MNLPAPAATWAVLWLCAAIAAAVFAVMLHSIATFPGPGRAAGGSARRRRALAVAAEIAWATIPIAIMAATAVPAVHALLAAA